MAAALQSSPKTRSPRPPTPDRPTQRANQPSRNLHLDRRNLFLFGDPERRAAATGRDHVWVFDLEAGALEPVDEVDRRALDVRNALGVDQQADALVLEHAVTGALLVERERILKARAASASHADAEPGRLGDCALRLQELPDLL